MPKGIFSSSTPREQTPSRSTLLFVENIELELSFFFQAKGLLKYETIH